ncbi:glycosyltransferase family 4 protein [Streptomyces sp. ISL-87]|nr:glycosyltransferase family 4 protein [Streptomyces sp. ISL-21]MBT2611888.1 glycosyltransferase family 4 protein [Streptomyces sp. ISL-87]
METHLADLVRELRRRGHEILCLVGGEESDETWEGVPVHRRPLLRPEELLRVHRAGAEGRAVHLRSIEVVVCKLLDSMRPHVVHLHNAHHYGPQLAHGVLAAVDAARGQAGRTEPVVLNSVHDHTGEHVLRDVMDLPWNLLLYVSDFLRASLPSRAPSVTLPLGIDVSRFASEGPRHEALDRLERPVIFHPARPLPWKGVDIGLEAFVDVRRRLGRASLVLCSGDNIIGESAVVSELRRRLTRYAADAGVAGHVVFQDFPPLAMGDAYRGCDLVWYPTTGEEPYGLVPLEAMASERPVVVADSGGLVETVVDGVNGLVVPRGDSGALARAALRLLDDDAGLRRRVVAGGLETARRCGIDAYTGRLENMYTAVHSGGFTGDSGDSG